MAFLCDIEYDTDVNDPEDFDAFAAQIDKLAAQGPQVSE